MSSELCPKGSVELECQLCGWATWFEPLAPEVNNFPYICVACKTNPIVGFKCTACNRMSKKSHRELNAEKEYAHHCESCIAEGVPYHSFAKNVYCWCSDNKAPYPDYSCPNLATQVKHHPKYCDCPACWQTFYHVCDYHASQWIEDLPHKEQRRILIERGLKITDHPDGSFSYTGERINKKDN